MPSKSEALDNSIPTPDIPSESRSVKSRTESRRNTPRNPKKTSRSSLVRGKKQIIIVESPTKAKTISKFLGKDYHVLSSYGHIRDLPRSKLGVDVENNFEPKYLVPKKAKPRVKELKAELKKAAGVVLATDEDREGEAIAWHITETLDLPKGENTKRIVFHEITKKAIEEALERPRDIDMNLVNAQQARRILDRLVGYELSPFLWKKLMRGLSAGRVQSAALRLIVEREEERKKFAPQEYWTVGALLATKTKETFCATLSGIGGKKLEKFDIPKKEQSDAIITALSEATWSVTRVTKKEMRKSPPPPFTTSTLQQEASKKLRFTARQTMMFAQQLYEGVELPEEGSVGLITYMRTDSVNLSAQSVAEARHYIEERFGKTFLPDAPHQYKTKSKLAQEAHEAIRPTDPSRHPDNLKDHLTKEQWKLYNLIWSRFLACQMEAAVFDTSAVDAEARPPQGPAHLFRANGIVKKFAGFLEVYPLKFEDAVLPALAEGDKLTAQKIEGEQHFTQPPPRYSEASLIKALEENGIGRPSTYAPTLATIQSRGYVERDEKRRLAPTEIGNRVNGMLVTHFPEIVDIAFTATMEENLDGVAEGKTEWHTLLKDFYGPFHKNLEAKYEEVQKINMEEKTNEICDKCGGQMVIRMGRFGRFLACSKFPECKNTKTIRKSTGMTCPACNEGEIVERRTKKKRVFWGCSLYPKCEYATWTNPVKRAQESEPAPVESEENEEKEE